MGGTVGEAWAKATALHADCVALEVAMFSDAIIVTDDGVPWGRWFTPPRHFAEGEIFADLCGASFIPAPTTMIRRDVLDAVGGYDERRFVEDYACGCGSQRAATSSLAAADV